VKRQAWLMQEIAMLLSGSCVGKPCPFTVPGEPHDTALRCSVRSRGGEVSEERSLQQVDMSLWHFDLGHWGILCQTDASIPAITASSSPGNLASSSTRRNVASFR